MTGTAFLLLYLVLLAIATIVSIVATQSARPEGRVDPAPSPETLAWLAGGRQRLVDTLVARALTASELRMTGRQHFAEANGPELSWSALSRRHEAHADALEQQLCRNGQVMDVDTLSTMRRRALLPFAVVGAIGTLRLSYGIAVARPVGFLLILLVATAAIALIRVAAIGRHTLGGRETLARARAANDRLRRAPRTSEMDMGVALFGTAVLAGSAYAPYHQLRSSDGGGSGDSGGDGGSSDGGGGGCGGGCGGCGS